MGATTAVFLGEVTNAAAGIVYRMTDGIGALVLIARKGDIVLDRMELSVAQLNAKLMTGELTLEAPANRTQEAQRVGLGIVRKVKDEAVQGVAEHVFAAVLEALQPAEEIGGPGTKQYIALMRKVAREATRRADTAAAESGRDD